MKPILFYDTETTGLPDFAQVCTKATDDFAALYAMRKQQRAEAEARMQAMQADAMLAARKEKP